MGSLGYVRSSKVKVRLSGWIKTSKSDLEGLNYKFGEFIGYAKMGLERLN